MTGETDLQALLIGMRPHLADGVLVFASLPPGVEAAAGLHPVMIFREREGLSLIVAEEEATRAGITATYRCRMITLDIHSSLAAVGFLATITTALAADGLGANAVSAFHHDHLFVAVDEAERVMAVLNRLSLQTPSITGLDHLQLAMPEGGEDQARAFYADLLGFIEEAKPSALAARGGLWLHGNGLKLHLGVEAGFRPARKAHPAFRVRRIDPLAERLAAAGIDLKWDQDILDVRRFFATDPFGNRIEFLEG